MPESFLNSKMHGTLNFYREVVAANIVRVSKEDYLTNFADLFTKVLGKFKRDIILKKCMHCATELLLAMVCYCSVLVLVGVSTACANHIQSYLNIRHLKGPSKH